MEFLDSQPIEAILEFIGAHRGEVPCIPFAAQYFNVEVCQALLERGENVHAVDKFDATVYHYAALNDRHGLQLIDFFVSCGVDVQREDKNEIDAVTLALHKHNLDFAIKLFECFDSEMSFLSHCISEDFDLLKEAFERDWSVAETDEGVFDEELVFRAAAFVSLDVVKWVINIAENFGKYYSDVDNDGFHVGMLMKAAMNEIHGEQITRYVIETYKPDPAEFIYPLYEAVAMSENFRVAKALLDHGANVESLLDGVGLLERCVENDALEGVKFAYIANGGSAMLDAELLLKAARVASVGMCEWLAERCCRLDDHVWLRFLQSVVKNVRRGKKIVLAFRDKLQAHVNAADAIGITPLHSAMMNKNVGVAEALVEIGADLNVRFKGANLLHFCLTQDYLDGAIFVHSKDSSQLNKRAALRIAYKKGNQEMKEWLIQY